MRSSLRTCAMIFLRSDIDALLDFWRSQGEFSSWVNPRHWSWASGAERPDIHDLRWENAPGPRYFDFTGKEPQLQLTHNPQSKFYPYVWEAFTQGGGCGPRFEHTGSVGLSRPYTITQGETQLQVRCLRVQELCGWYLRDSIEEKRLVDRTLRFIRKLGSTDSVWVSWPDPETLRLPESLRRPSRYIIGPAARAWMLAEPNRCLLYHARSRRGDHCLLVPRDCLETRSYFLPGQRELAENPPAWLLQR